MEKLISSNIVVTPYESETESTVKIVIAFI